MVIIFTIKIAEKMSDYFRQHSNVLTTIQTGESWIILSSFENQIKQKIENIGTPLKNWNININRGILTGYNEAFIINKEIKDELVQKSSKNAEIIRPIILGKNIKRYQCINGDTWLINSHNGIKTQNIQPVNLESEYPTVLDHLRNFLPKIKERADQGNQWYNLRNCAYLNEFDKPKIVWSNLATSNQFSFISDPMILCAPSNFISTDNLYLLGVLNSKLADYYIKQLGVTRNGGYFEYKPMFVEQLPIPKVSEDKQTEISQLVSQILKLKENNGDTTNLETQIDNIVFDIYQLTPEEVAIINTF